MTAQGDRRHRRVALVGLACLGLAALSLLMPSAPTTDPWGWILWGRELAHLHLDTEVGGAPSWKPLPVLLTTPYALAGDAAPFLWLLTARAGALLSLVFAFRLASRVSGAAAGLVAAAALLLSEGWLRAFAHGYSEPLVAGLLLAALERHLDARRAQALALGGLASLARPELFLFVLAYAPWAMRAGQRRRGAIAVCAAVPLLWIVPDWLASGELFHGGAVAGEYSGRGADAALGSARSALGLVLPAVALGALAAGAIALSRRRSPLMQLALSFAVAFGVLLVLMLLGYPASRRFFEPLAGLLSVLGGAGLVEAVRLMPVRGLRLAAAAAVFLAALPSVLGRVGQLQQGLRGAEARAELEGELRSSLRRVDSRALRGCTPLAVPIGMGWTKGAIAWELDLKLREITDVEHSAHGFVSELQSAGAHRAGRRPAGGRVRLSPLRPMTSPGAVVAPFAAVSLRGSGTLSGLIRVQAGGRWGIAVPSRSPCRRAMARPRRPPA